MGTVNREALKQFQTQLTAGIEAITERFVQTWVVVASVESPEGVEAWFYNTKPGQGVDVTLGLLESAVAGEKFRIGRDFPVSHYSSDNSEHDD